MINPKSTKGRPNIVLDFTVNQSIANLTAGQPLAIMPAELSKKLLTVYAENLISVKPSVVIEEHILLLKEAAATDNLDWAVNLSIGWLQERDLIQNIRDQKWDLYDITKQQVQMEQNY